MMDPCRIYAGLAAPCGINVKQGMHAVIIEMERYRDVEKQRSREAKTAEVKRANTETKERFH